VPSAGRPRATFLKFEEYLLLTLLVFTASPAGRAAPQKLAYQEIARSAAGTEPRETGPGVERARIRPLALLSSAPVPEHASGRLCALWMFPRLSAQSCTNEKSRPVSMPRITITNHCYLEDIGFDPQNRAQPAPTCVHPRRLMAGNQNRREHKIRIIRLNREFVLSAAAQEPSSRAASPIRVNSRPKCPRRVHRGAQTQEPLPLAAPRITKAKDSHLSKIGFVPQKSPSRSGGRTYRAYRQLLSEPYYL
jgi:hypothetical protein